MYHHSLPLPRLHSRKHPRVDSCSSRLTPERTTSLVRRAPPSPTRFAAPASCTTKKAPPTLSITSTNVSRSGTPSAPWTASDDPDLRTPQACPVQSTIPFPSAPIDFPARRGDREDDLDADSGLECVDAKSAAPAAGQGARAELRRDVDWRQLRRRCTQSCTTTSYVHRDSVFMDPKPPVRRAFAPLHVNVSVDAPTQTQPEPSGPGLVGPATPERTGDVDSADAQLVAPPSRQRRHSVSAGCGPFRPTPRRARKARKSAIDMQFLALVHRSIAWHARDARAAQRGGAVVEADTWVNQDVELAKRLWGVLAGRGCKPTPFEQDPAPATPLVHRETGGERGVPVSASKGQGREPLISPTSETTVASTAPTVLTMPQLVASMTLRFRDRMSSRPRAPIGVGSPSENIAERPSRPRSALGRAVLFGDHSEAKEN